MPGSFRLGKIAGIDIYAHLSWFIVLVLLVAAFSQFHLSNVTDSTQRARIYLCSVSQHSLWER